MAVFRPKRNGIQSKNYVCEFVIHSKRIQESTGASSKTVAKEYEKRRRAELERAAAGLPMEEKAPRLRCVAEVVKRYLDGYQLNHRSSSCAFANSRLTHVNHIFGQCLLSELNEDRVRGYIRQRLSEGVSGRTINMELGELSRAVGKSWRELWPRVRKLEERRTLAALSQGQNRTFSYLASNTVAHRR